MVQEFARGLSDVIIRHQSFAAVVAGISGQVSSAMLQNALMDIATLDMTREKEAAAAARKAFLWGWQHGGPAAPVLAPAFGAMAFAAEMAFAKGGIVPGVGLGDVVPAMLTPGEAVLPKSLTEGLTNAARSGSMGNAGPTYHVHLRPTYHVNTIDGDGMHDALEKHTDVLQKHFESSVRRMHGR